MRTIDDFAMQSSIHQMQTNILNFSFAKVFFYFEYAYGWLFWMVYSVSTFPFFLYSKISNSELSEQLVIFSIRQISVVILCLILFYSQKLFQLMMRESEINSLVVSKYLSTSWLLYPAVGYWAGRPQPPLLVTLMLILACYRILKVKIIRPKDFILFVLSLSLIVATKLNTILVIPYICGLIFIYRKEQIVRLFRQLKLFYTLVLSFLVFLLAASPMILLQPQEYGLRFLRYIYLFSNLSVGQDFTITNFFDNLKIGLIKNSIGFSSLIIIVIIINSITSIKKIKFSSKNILSILLVMTILLIAAVSVNGPSYFNSYVLPLSIFFPLHIYKLVPVWGRSYLIFAPLIILAGIASLIFSLSRISSQTESINSYQIIHQKAVLNKDYLLRSKIEKIINSYGDNKIEIIQDYTIPTAKTNFDPAVYLSFVYGDWESKKSPLVPTALFLLVDYRQYLSPKGSGGTNSSTPNNPIPDNSRKDKVLDKLNEEEIFDGRICSFLNIVDGVGVYRCAGG
jgi:hypothetical protein